MERIPATVAAAGDGRRHRVTKSQCHSHHRETSCFLCFLMFLMFLCISYVSYAYVLIRSGWLSVCVLHKRALRLQVLCVLASGSSFPLAFCQYTFSTVCILLGQQGMTQHAVLKRLLVCECIPSEALESSVSPQESHDVSDISYEPHPSL